MPQTGTYTDTNQTGTINVPVENGSGPDDVLSYNVPAGGSVTISGGSTTRRFEYSDGRT